MKVIFVCTGNTCRSPMAEAIARDLFEKSGLDLEIVSRGIAVFSETKASNNSLLAAKDLGLDLSSHVSKQLTKEDIKNANMIITMTNEHKNMLWGLCNDMNKEIYTLYELAYNNELNIADPYGLSIIEYRNCLMEIKDCVEKIIPVLENKWAK